MSRALRPFFVNVTWGAGGSTAAKSLELAELCHRQLHLTTCLHLTCTNMNRSLIDQALEKAKAIGIRNILALRGDPPRNEEYFDQAELDDSNSEFTWAVDLVRYIRKKYGDYFCIGVAAYPEGHSDQSHPEVQDPKFDLEYLIEKTKAGADFLMTQLFYDVKAYEDFEDMLRSDPSGAFKTIPIIPGLMPIQSYQILKRTTKLSHAKLPPDMLARLDAVKGDDEAVKSVGVDVLSETIERLKERKHIGPRGFHFYTLNLEKVVSHIVERCHLIRDLSAREQEDNNDNAVEETNDGSLLSVADAKPRLRLPSVSSDPYNRVVVEKSSGMKNKDFEASEKEAGIPSHGTATRANTLAISEGEGALGREATWDDYPNGRWGDARSPGKFTFNPELSCCAKPPAFGEIDGYGVSLHVSIPQAIKLWSYPTAVEDITTIFRKHIAGELDAIPWSEEGLNPETTTIREELLKVNAKGWWTVASQPAVNGMKSNDDVFGWGPRNGFVFQKVSWVLFLQTSHYADIMY
jgi:methylenetetrahydrofolate reductase (NADPH)